jgi:hypothetical protein
MCSKAAPMLSSANIVSIGSCGLGDVEFARVFSHNLCHGVQAEANRRLRHAALSCRAERLQERRSPAVHTSHREFGSNAAMRHERRTSAAGPD